MVSAPASKHGVRFGAFEVDFGAGELRKHGVRINLQEQPFRLLAALLEQPGQLVTRDELRQQIWPADTFVDFDCSLNTAVLKIRQALGDSATHSRFLETVPKRGYRFVAPIEALTLGTAPTTSIPVEAVVRARGMHRLRWPVAAAVICLIVLVVAGKWWSTRGRGGKPIRAVVVLPLQNLSGDSSQDYFAGGMTEELITALAKIDAISVIKGTGKRVDQIVHEFHVDAIVEGSLVRSGERVRISAKLIQASTGRYMWADNYEGNLREILELQSEVAQRIAREIRVKLSPEDQVRLARIKPINPAAYQLYLKGRFFWEKRTEADLRKAINYFRQAIGLDPAYGLAYAGIAHAYIPMLNKGFVSRQEGAQPLRLAALKAQQLDDSLPETHTALAGAALDARDWAGVERQLRKAIELNPNYATAHLWYGYHLERVGRFSEGLRERQRAYAIDPLNIVISDAFAQALKLSGQTERAKAQFMKTLELFPESRVVHEDVGMFFEGEGQYDMAIQEFKKAGSMDSLAHAYAVSGKRSAAEQILKQMNAASARRYLAPFGFAVVYAGLGEKEQALSWLERACEVGDYRLNRLKVDPRLASLRLEPRYQDLLRRMNLPQ